MYKKQILFTKFLPDKTIVYLNIDPILQTYVFNIQTFMSYVMTYAAKMSFNQFYKRVKYKLPKLITI